jgi:hypothetical protein
VKNTTTSVKHVHMSIVFPNSFCMKNVKSRSVVSPNPQVIYSCILDMLCVISCLYPVPQIAQIYVVNLFIWIVFYLCRIWLNYFLATNNYVFAPNFYMLSLYAKMHLWWINHNFIFVRNIYSWNMPNFLCKCRTQNL